jgi:hypothetical protein
MHLRISGKAIVTGGLCCLAGYRSSQVEIFLINVKGNGKPAEDALEEFHCQSPMF